MRARELDRNQNVYNQVIDKIKAIYLNGWRLFNINLDVDWCSHALGRRKKPRMPWWLIHVQLNAEISIEPDHSVEFTNTMPNNVRERTITFGK